VRLYSAGVAAVALFAVIYNVPRYFESTFVWNATANVGYFARTSLGSSTLYTTIQTLLKYPLQHWSDD